MQGCGWHGLIHFSSHSRPHLATLVTSSMTENPNLPTLTPWGSSTTRARASASSTPALTHLAATADAGQLSVGAAGGEGSPAMGPALHPGATCAVPLAVSRAAVVAQHQPPPWLACRPHRIPMLAVLRLPCVHPEEVHMRHAFATPKQRRPRCTRQTSSTGKCDSASSMICAAAAPPGLTLAAHRRHR